MVRDLIEKANQAAFIFFDQKKSYDRVSHKFLFKVMDTFGIGHNFIDSKRKLSNLTFRDKWLFLWKNTILSQDWIS